MRKTPNPPYDPPPSRPLEGVTYAYIHELQERAERFQMHMHLGGAWAARYHLALREVSDARGEMEQVQREARAALAGFSVMT